MHSDGRGVKRFKISLTDDLEAVMALHTLCFPDDEFYKHRGNRYWLVHEGGDSPVGFCMATVWKDGLLFLSRAGLLSCARGYGLHRRMIRVRERFARSLGLVHVLTYVKITNPGSFVSLIKCGYRVYEPEYKYGGDDALYLMKDLLPSSTEENQP